MLGRMMRDLDVSTLGQLSTMIPARPRSKMWPLVYRDLCEWAVLYDLVCYERWGSDTLIIRDGLLRSTIFAQDQFVRVYGLMKAAVERTKRERNRDVFLVGLAKHSRIIERYRLAIPVAQGRYVRARLRRASLRARVLAGGRRPGTEGDHAARHVRPEPGRRAGDTA